MKDFGMHHVSAKFVPRLLTDDLLQRANDYENLSEMSFPVMRRRFMVMMLKPNNNPHTGHLLLHLAPRKHNRCACE
jgi:hypothetical protein